MHTGTFFEKLMEQLPLRDKTKVNYKNAFKNNIAPYVAECELDSITKSMIFELLAPLPPQTRYQSFMILRVIFREAMLRELVEINPMQGIPTPRVRVESGEFLTWNELQGIDFGKQTQRIRFLALHGLRWGEAAALTPADIKEGVIHVTRSIHGETKSAAGMRKIPLMSEFVPFARSQRAVANALKPHGVTVHSLRKTYAYILKSSGIHVTTAAKLMGHANPMVTLKIYTLVLDSEMELSREMMIKSLSLTL